jgi:hypothetical protein
MENTNSCSLSISSVFSKNPINSGALWNTLHMLTFCKEKLSVSHITPKLTDHPMSAVWHCLFKTAAATLPICLLHLWSDDGTMLGWLWNKQHVRPQNVGQNYNRAIDNKSFWHVAESDIWEQHKQIITADKHKFRGLITYNWFTVCWF